MTTSVPIPSIHLKSQGWPCSHAFDSSGALYDEYGNYNVWWTDEEMAEYKKMSQSIIDYYSNYEMMGTKVNGI